MSAANNALAVRPFILSPFANRFETLLAVQAVSSAAGSDGSLTVEAVAHEFLAIIALHGLGTGSMHADVTSPDCEAPKADFGLLADGRLP